MTSGDDVFGPRLQQIRAQNQQEQSERAAKAAAFAAGPGRLAEQVDYLLRRLMYKQVPTREMSLGHADMKEIEDPSDRSWRRSKRRKITVVAKPAPTVQAWTFVADHRVDLTCRHHNIDVALTKHGTLHQWRESALYEPDLLTLEWCGPGRPAPKVTFAEWLCVDGADIFIGKNMWDPDQPSTEYYALSDSLAQWYATLM